MDARESIRRRSRIYRCARLASWASCTGAVPAMPLADCLWNTSRLPAALKPEFHIGESRGEQTPIFEAFGKIGQKPGTCSAANRHNRQCRFEISTDSAS